MGNGFAASGQRIATVNVEDFHEFPTRILGPELMDKFREQPLHFGTRQEDEEPETADTVIVATGASAEERRYCRRGISACVVCDGDCSGFQGQTPPAVIGGGDSAAEEATCTSDLTKYGSHVCTILWNTVAAECQGNDELSKNFRIRNAQTGEEKDSAVTKPQRRSFRTQLQTNPDGYIVTVPGTDSNFHERRFCGWRCTGKRYRQAITSAGSRCMAALEAERSIAESEDKEMMGE
ncbi:hypothetical protein K435DRAFT_827109 [Dendrothele bispora CBS 962.96]|uniref:FAD/NAD(P)-binding domain-containing protein n=1 Tax=Dendrothele bispora (strain CBS 962.96) TaxID=1314807 RepID=A0A4S8ML10_DENBC|nr:hypothetical protein K435DRAFT_827109 [Dendrothele bispora CBS 962.96]